MVPICGKISNDEFMLVGGSGTHTSRTSEIYTASSNSWRMGPNVPGTDSFSAAQLVQAKGRLFLVGGKRGSGTKTDTIYEYDKDANEWITHDEKLPYPTWGHLSYPVTKSTMLCVK